jgi:hypothetical protein
MRISFFGKLILASVFAAASTSLWAQAQLDMSVTYAAERAQIAPGTCGCFWLQGGGADVALTFWKGVGAAVSLTGDHVSNYSSGYDINKIAFMGGPRYTHTAWTRRASTARPSWQIFGEVLFGGVHAFNGAFPSGAALTATASSFALQTGGGINLFFSRSIALRLLEADYVRTDLPNNYSKSQNDLRLAFGVSYHFGSAPVR